MVILKCLLLSIVVLQATAHTVDKSLHRERGSDGAFAGRGEQYDKTDEEHHKEFDHMSILGSNQDAEEYDNLSPEEAKKSLAVLFKKMDVNSDGSIDQREMHQWILGSFKMISAEESSERFEETDEDEDDFVSWREHLVETFGSSDETEGDDSNTLMIAEDKQLFAKADKDGDGKLNEEEFLSFSHPEEDPAMVPILVDQALNRDTDKDGRISFKEYMTAVKKGDLDDEALLAEKDHFDEDYDKDLDGFLNRQEIQNWVVPDVTQTANEETQHLFATADGNEDGLLSLEEVLDNHDTFVGSEATDYGEHLHNMHRFDDEL